MPQEGRKFTFTLHSYQSFTTASPPDLRIKIGELHNDGSVEDRKMWLSIAAQSASLAREYTRSALDQVREEDTSAIIDLLKRYFFLKENLGSHSDKLRKKHLTLIRANIANLHQELQKALEILGTGTSFDREEQPTGYVKTAGVVTNGKTTTRKIHIMLDDRRKLNKGEEITAITKTLIHEASHKFCNTYDYFYDPGPEKKPDIPRGTMTYEKGGQKNQDDLARLRDMSRKYSDDDLDLHEKILKGFYARNNADSYARFICAFALRSTFDHVTKRKGWRRHVGKALDTLVPKCEGMMPGEAIEAEEGMQVTCTGKKLDS
jgi:hypothetical protein